MSNQQNRRSKWWAALALAGLLVTGCKTWQPLWPTTAEKHTKGDEIDKADTTGDTIKPHTRSTGRSPIQATGINDQSREIERNLGAR